MRGYFGIGVEGISKSMNVGSIFRTAHAFEAEFVFTIGANYSLKEGKKSDTTGAHNHIPFYQFDGLNEMILPKNCALVGVELIENSIELPSFHHPSQAAYVLGPERGSLSKTICSRCDHIVQIPTQFCINVSVAAAIIMYDRVQSRGRFFRRPERPGGPLNRLTKPFFGEQKFRSKAKKYISQPPLDVHPKEND